MAGPGPAGYEAPPEGPPEWATDMVTTELRRAYPSGVSKAELEERTGIGPGELRAVMAFLEEEGIITDAETEAGSGWRYLEPDERMLGPAAPEATESDAEPDGGEDPPEALEGAEGLPAAAPAGEGRASGTRYGVRLALEAFYHSEPGDGETDDEAAVRESRDITAAAVNAILDQYPGLSISVDTMLYAYDNPRRIA